MRIKFYSSANIHFLSYTTGQIIKKNSKFFFWSYIKNFKKNHIKSYVLLVRPSKPIFEVKTMAEMDPASFFNEKMIPVTI